MTARKRATILTDASIMAIVPTTDIAQATAFYGGLISHGRASHLLVARGATAAQSRCST
jgi:hypothetical protein